MSDELARVWVHPDLVEEFKQWKLKIEEKSGRPLKGGVPIISKIFAEILKNDRLKNKKTVKIELQKLKGLKKNEVIFL